MDLHHNLFYSYRGPISDDGSRERQLENNVTRALITTLRLGGESVWRPFLADLAVPEANLADPTFLLQRSNLPAGSTKFRNCRILLGISREPSKWSVPHTLDNTYKSIPDAWIYGHGFAVLVESKVAGDFVDGQMVSHLVHLTAPDAEPPFIILKTWRDLHQFFHSLLPEITGTAALLVEQFIEYLEYCDMSGFTGFRREHFDYFLAHDDEDARIWIKQQVADLAEQIQSRLQEIDPFYENWDQGQLKRTDEYCWVAFGPKNYRQVTHQSIDIRANGLRVFVNSELKSATDGIKTALEQSAHTVREALSKLHAFEPFDLILKERVQKQASLYEYVPKMQLHSSLLSDGEVGDLAWRAFADTLQRLPLPYIRIDRLIDTKSLLDMSQASEVTAIERIVEMIERNHAVVKLLNTT